MYEPKEGWAYKLDDVPKDENVSDYTLGALLLAFKERKILLKDLKRYDILFTSNGIVREERKPAARAFKMFDGHIIKNGKTYFNGSETLEPENHGTWAMDNLRLGQVKGQFKVALQY